MINPGGNISVIGAGTMGNGIAHVFAQNGFKVSIVDVSLTQLDRAIINIGKNFDRQIAKGAATEEQKKNALANISIYSKINDGVKDADLIVEAATENIELKLKIFEEVDKFAPKQAILASNTSSISITKIAAHTKRADKVIGMHFMNPVPVMKLVEVIRGQETSPETIATVVACTEALDKVPVEASDYPGFVSNRVLMPMINEAVYCLMEGVSTREGIDSVMKLGMTHPLGPLALADLIGLDVCLDILEVLHAGLGDDKYRPCPLLRRYVAAGRLGKKNGKGFYKYA